VEGGGEDGLIALVQVVFEVGAIGVGGGEAVPGLFGGAGEEGVGAEVEGVGGAAFGFSDFGESVGGGGRSGVAAEGGFEGFAGLGGAAIGLEGEAEGFLVEVGLGGSADFGGAAGGVEGGGRVFGGEEFGGEGLEEAGLVVALGLFRELGDGFGGGGGVVFDEGYDELALSGRGEGGGEIGELEELLESIDAGGGVLCGGDGGEALGEFGEGGWLLGDGEGEGQKDEGEGERPGVHQQVVPYLFSMKHLIAVIWLAAAALAPAQDNVNAVLWQQTAAEYRAATIQAFRAASAVLPRALADRQWTAALEQRAMDAERLAALPPAIIVDVDETIVDNAPAAARDIRERNGVFDPKAWTQWTSEAKAKALAGAREFLGEARLRGVTVFYVTNRGVEEAAATRRNLVEQGFEVLDLNNTLIPSTLLVKDDSKKWGSDKTTRRAVIARNYRIVMLCGDDLNDFVSVYGLSRAERDARARLYDEWWGERWILLPNPSYGTWERALGQDKRGALDLAGQ
jgi:5'-nucleotidase (lipoprotein e(P4) family)